MRRIIPIALIVLFESVFCTAAFPSHQELSVRLPYPQNLNPFETSLLIYKNTIFPDAPWKLPKTSRGKKYTPLWGCNNCSCRDFLYPWMAFPAIGDGYWGVPGAYIRKDWVVTVYPKYLGDKVFSNMHMTPVFIKTSFPGSSNPKDPFFQADGFRRFSINDNFWLLLVHVEHYPIFNVTRPITLKNSYTGNELNRDRIAHTGVFFVDTDSKFYDNPDYPKCDQDPLKWSHDAGITGSSGLALTASCLVDGQPVSIDYPGSQLNYLIKTTQPEISGTEVLTGLAENGENGLDAPCNLDNRFYNLALWEDFLVSNAGISFQSSWVWVNKEGDSLPQGYFRANGNEAIYYRSHPLENRIEPQDTLSSTPRAGFCRIKPQNSWVSGVVHNDRKMCMVVDDSEIRFYENYQVVAGSPLMPSVDYDALPGGASDVNEVVKDPGYTWLNLTELNAGHPVFSGFSEAPGISSAKRDGAFCKSRVGEFDEIGVLDITEGYCQIIVQDNTLLGNSGAEQNATEPAPGGMVGADGYYIQRMSEYMVLAHPVQETGLTPLNPPIPRPGSEIPPTSISSWDEKTLPAIQNLTIIGTIVTAIIVVWRASK